MEGHILIWDAPKVVICWNDRFRSSHFRCPPRSMFEWKNMLGGNSVLEAAKSGCHTHFPSFLLFPSYLTFSFSSTFMKCIWLKNEEKGFLNIVLSYEYGLGFRGPQILKGSLFIVKAITMTPSLIVTGLPSPNGYTLYSDSLGHPQGCRSKRVTLW